MFGEDNLLLRTFDDSRELGFVCYLQLAAGLFPIISPSPRESNQSRPQKQTYNIRQLRLRNQILRLRPHELLLEDDEALALGLLELELLDLVCDFRLSVAAGLHALLRVTDGLEDGAGLVEAVRVRVLLRAQLR